MMNLQAGYNLLYSVWRYSFDADCSLFLKILKGDLKEDVFVQQINLQVNYSLKNLFPCLLPFKSAQQFQLFIA